MGLSFDANKTLGVPNSRQIRKKIYKLVHGFVEESASETEETVADKPKKHVADTLEAEATEYVESRFRLPKGVCKEAAYYMDTYGLDYKAMAKDPKNYYQETWRQIRAKVRKFMSISDHFSLYLAERDLLDGDIDENDPRWKEAETDDD